MSDDPSPRSPGRTWLLAIVILIVTCVAAGTLLFVGRPEDAFGVAVGVMLAFVPYVVRTQQADHGVSLMSVLAAVVVVALGAVLWAAASEGAGLALVAISGGATTLVLELIVFLLGRYERS